MSGEYVKQVARYTAKTVRRSWLFRIIILISCLLMVVLCDSDTNMSFPFNLSYSANPSHLAYLLVSDFSLLLVFPLLFLTDISLQRGIRIDSNEVLLSRPLSNAAYRWGVMWGVVRPLMMLGFWLLLPLVPVAWLFTPFSVIIHYALFYYLTLTLPVLVFYAGWSVFVCSVLPNRALRLAVLLMSVILPLFFLQDMAQGLLNPFGYTLPVLFSEITGFDRPVFFLLQRSCWVLLGLGFTTLSVVLFRRLPNHPRLVRVRLLTGMLLTLAGVLCAFLYYGDHLHTKSLRRQYVDTYRCYEEMPKMELEAQELTFEQRGRRVRVESRLLVSNPEERRLEKSFLYLNPGLKVLELTDRQGDAIPFTRRHQVVELDYPLPPGISREIRMVYEGVPDQAICYVDIADADYYRMPNRNGQTGVSNRYFFAEKEYTLLTPEALWYPVCKPPVSVERRERPFRDFSRYTLHVVLPEGREVVSAGKRVESGGNRVSFLPEHPLDGLFLCMGRLKRLALQADSLTVEACIHQSHTALAEGLEGITDTLPGGILRLKELMEYYSGLTYPFSYFRLVETPLTLRTFVRQPTMESSLVQPATLFLPERGDRDGYLDLKYRIAYTRYGISQGWYQQKEISEAEMVVRAIQSFSNNALTPLFTARVDQEDNLVAGLIQGAVQDVWERMQNRANPYQVSALFKERRFELKAPEYPGLNHLLGDRFRLGMRNQGHALPIQHEQQQVLDYLMTHSFAEALEDPAFPEELLFRLFDLKSSDLINRLAAAGMDEGKVMRFVADYYQAHSFRSMPFADFNRTSVDSLGLDWHTVLSPLYADRGVAEFIVAEFSARQIDPALLPADFPYQDWFRIAFEVYNPSETDGVITLSFMRPARQTLHKRYFMTEEAYRFWRDREEMSDRHYLVPARSGKRVAFNVPIHSPYVTLLAPVSRNRPQETTLHFNYLETGMARDTVQQVVELSMADLEQRRQRELVVDNESPGFSVAIPSGSERKNRRFLRSSAPEEYAAGVYVTAQRNDWCKLLDNGYYGDVIRSIHAKRAGDGASASWTVTIPEAGEYEIEAYAPYSLRLAFDRHSLPKGRREYLEQGDPGSAPFRQFYRIGGEEIPIAFEAGKGWLSLGRFSLSPGEHTVTLTDRGFANQIIMADAVRWIRVK